MNLDVAVADVIGDVAIVIVLSSLLGAAARRCGQPAAIGQILTGILLGPSLLGRLPGHLTNRLFPHHALPYLSVLSQVAVVIFMFVVGYEIDFRSLRGRGRAVPLVASSALLVPMGLGAASVLLFRTEFAATGEHHTDSRSFVLFMAVATSVTALPVLAAIARERGLAGTTAGTVATSAAGIMDVTAWLVLAAALIGTRYSANRPWVVTLLLIACFAAIMLFAVRPAIRWRIGRPGSLLTNPVPIAFALTMGSAWVTASLGLHPVFGAFLAGLTMPGRNGAPDAEVIRPMEEVGNLLLPLFFVITGLSLNIGALHGDALALLALVFVIASVGKLGPAFAAARLGGLDPRQSATVAALVNTRGLTELIALNVGLNNGIIHQRLFTILVLMALITTIMTSPLLSLVGRMRAQPPSGEPLLAVPSASADET